MGGYMRKIRLSRLLLTSSILALTAAAGSTAASAACITYGPGSVSAIGVTTSTECVVIQDATVPTDPNNAEPDEGGAAFSNISIIGESSNPGATVLIDD